MRFKIFSSPQTQDGAHNYLFQQNGQTTLICYNQIHPHRSRAKILGIQNGLDVVALDLKNR